MIRCFILLLFAYGSIGYGYDSGGDQAACGRPYRSGRMHQPPCDLGRQSFCTSAGTDYPWHAVKRFVRDNQGLMRRMYGDQRHGHVLRAELQEDVDPWDPLHEWQPPPPPRYARYQLHNDDIDNELDPTDPEIEIIEARFLKDEVSNDDVLNTKFVYSEEPAIAIKLAGLKTAPHFRPTTQKTTTTTSGTTTGTTTASTPTTTFSSSTASTAASTTKESESTERSTQTIATSTNVEDTTTDTTTDQTTTSKIVANDRIGLVEELETTTKERPPIIQNDEVEADSSASSSNTVGTMLFQDTDSDSSKNKMHINFKLKGVNACPVKEEVVAPFWANNTRGEVLALLNMYPFEQYVHWEKCLHEHRQMYCREGCRCEQQYRLHRLLAYDPKNECRGIFSDWFRFPSCCVCKCYDMPPEFRVTSRSPRFHQSFPDG